jgi:predicted enzyme related to lactoylglutathione lyase
VKPSYFDLTVTDLAGARQFFAPVLGWQFRRFDLPYEHYRITAGPADEAGIDGGIGAASDAPLSAGRPMTLITMPGGLMSGLVQADPAAR